MSKELVALLPMKAHSERVPRKNFRDFLGKPLFRWVLDSLLSLEAVSRVVINTDARSELIDCGLEESDRVQIRDRRPEICGDLVSMNEVIADDLGAVPADAYLMTHTTNPLLSAATLASAIAQFWRQVGAGEADSLFSVNKVQTRFYRGDGSAVNHDPDNLIRTQDLEPWFEENSCFYLFTPASFAQTRARIGRQPAMFTTPWYESVDIDEPDDWDFAQLAARFVAQRGQSDA